MIDRTSDPSRADGAADLTSSCFDANLFEVSWERAMARIRELESLPEGWGGEGMAPTSKALVVSALQLAKLLYERDHPSPLGAYLLPDGNIILEWRPGREIIVRIEVEAVGSGQLMITYPDRPPEFSLIAWHSSRRPGHASGFHWIASRASRSSEDRPMRFQARSEMEDDAEADPFPLAA